MRNPLSKTVACWQTDQMKQTHQFAQLLLLAAVVLATPLGAQDQPAPNLVTQGRGAPGGVLRMYLARSLFAEGMAGKDALSVLNAARLAASVTLTDTPRTRETTPDAATATSPPSTPTDMFDTAASLAAGDDGLMDLIDASRREAGFAPLTNVVSSQSALVSNGTETWPQPFFGASLAEVAILGDGNGNLDMSITDGNGNLVCRDVGPSDMAYCSFFPAVNGTFQITVQNTEGAANTYLLLTN